MRDVAVAVARERGATFEEVDVDEDPVVAAQYDLEVPVLCVNGTKAFSISVTPKLLRQRLDAEGR